MDQVQLEQWKEQLRRWAAANPLISAVWIFGSQIKGTARPESDLDVAVRVLRKKGDSDSFTTAFFECPRWQKELTRLLGVPVDLEDVSGEHVGRFVEDASELIWCKAVS